VFASRVRSTASRTAAQAALRQDAGVSPGEPQRGRAGLGNQAMIRLRSASAGGETLVQRAPTLSIGPVDVKSNAPECQAYAPGEKERADKPDGWLPFDVATAGTYGVYPSAATVVVDFKTDDATLRPSMVDQLNMLIKLGTFPEKDRGSLIAFGHSDCVGWESVNAPLRQQRAAAVAKMLPGIAAGPAAYEDYLAPNDTPQNRALNRSVIIVDITGPDTPALLPNADPTPPKATPM